MIVVVLSRAQDLINIAHVVRALKNFGFRDLRLVSRASTTAIEWKASRTRRRTCSRAWSGSIAWRTRCSTACTSWGSRRAGRTAKRNLQRPREAAAEILARAEAARPRCFSGGRTRAAQRGARPLPRVVTIPTSPAYASSNLRTPSCSCCTSWRWRAATRVARFKAPRREGPPATVDELERLFTDAEAALRAIDSSRRVRPRRDADAARVIHRTPLDQREAKLLRAMAIEVVKYGERLARSRLHVDR